jgi:DAACS family dicarboxylate/amino acid:cation (Na+ or H+) symporter
VSEHPSAVEHSPDEPRRGLLARWHRTPLYLRIVGALFLGILTAVILSPKALPLPGIAFRELYGEAICHFLDVPSKLVLRLLNALAPALVLFAIIRALIQAEFGGRGAARLVGLLIRNTLVAIVIGLTVAAVVQPGRHARLAQPAASTAVKAQRPEDQPTLELLERYGFKPAEAKPDAYTQFLDNVPRSLVGPLTDNGKVIGVIFLAVAFGVALRRVRTQPIATVADFVEVGFGALLTILHWVIDVVPLAVFGIVANIVGTQGFSPFAALGAFVGAVLLALLLQGSYYLVMVLLQ